MTAQPHRFASASESLDDYERSLEAYTNSELVTEYEQAAHNFGARIHPGESCELVRRCRREVLRRMSNPSIPNR